MDLERQHSALDELAAHHLDRGQVYATVAALLDDTPVDGGVAAARAVLREELRVARRLSGLANLLFQLPAGDAIPLPLFTVLCSDPCATSRLAAHLAASRAPGPAKLEDIRALSALARETGRALRRGDIARAAALNDVQHGFLRDHACECLSALSGELLRSRAIIYVAAGQSLRAQLERDIDAG